jgi:integrase
MRNLAKDMHRLARNADDKRDAAAVLIAGFAGLRRGEIIGLRWGDVSLTDARIDVRRAVVLGKEVTPKSGKARMVPMARQVAQALADLDAARRAHAEAGGFPLLHCVMPTPCSGTQPAMRLMPPR